MLERAQALACLGPPCVPCVGIYVNDKLRTYQEANWVKAKAAEEAAPAEPAAAAEEAPAAE